MPEADVDYPGTWNQFMDWFSDESDCIDCIAYLEKIKLKNGFTCPSCGSMGKPYRITIGRLTCPTSEH